MRKIVATAFAAALLGGAAAWTLAPNGASAQQQFAPAGQAPGGMGMHQYGRAVPGGPFAGQGAQAQGAPRSMGAYGQEFGGAVQQPWSPQAAMRQPRAGGPPYSLYAQPFGQDPDLAQLPTEPVQPGWGYPPFMAQPGQGGAAWMGMNRNQGFAAQGPKAGLDMAERAGDPIRVQPQWIGPQGPMEPPAWAGFGPPIARADIPYRAPRPDLVQGPQGTQEAPTFVHVAPAAELVGRMVEDVQGEPVGTLEYLVLDARTGDIGYGLISAEPGGDFVPVPWTAVEVPDDPNEPLGVGIRLDKMRQAMQLSPENLVRLTQPQTVAEIAAFYTVPLGGQGGQAGGRSGAAGGQAGPGQPQLLVGPSLITMIAPPRYVMPGQLRHADVVTPSGVPIGEIDQVMVDVDRGDVAYLLLAGGGFLGMNRDWVPVPFEAIQWVPQQGVYVLPIRDQAIAALPRVPQGSLPTRVSGPELMALHRQFGIFPYWEQAGLTQPSMQEPKPLDLAREVLGSPVRGAGDQRIGTVADVVFDPQGEQPHRLVIELRGQDGPAKPVTVDFERAEWRQGVVVLPDTTREELRGREAFAYTDDMMSLRRMGTAGATGAGPQESGSASGESPPAPANRPPQGGQTGGTGQNR